MDLPPTAVHYLQLSIHTALTVGQHSPAAALILPINEQHISVMH